MRAKRLGGAPSGEPAAGLKLADAAQQCMLMCPWVGCIRMRPLSSCLLQFHFKKEPALSSVPSRARLCYPWAREWAHACMGKVCA